VVEERVPLARRAVSDDPFPLLGRRAQEVQQVPLDLGDGLGEAAVALQAVQASRSPTAPETVPAYIS
jgi:hypothetical protein